MFATIFTICAIGAVLAEDVEDVIDNLFNRKGDKNE